MALIPGPKQYKDTENIDTKALHRLRQGSSASTAGIFAFLLVIIVLQQTVTVQQNSLMARALLNSAHTPWFFVISMGLWLLGRNLFKLHLNQRVVIFSTTLVVLAFTLEALQLLSPRQASLNDVMRNLVGASTAICCLLARHLWQQSRFGTAAALSILALLVFLTGFKPVGDLLWLRYQLSAQAPILLDFRDPGSVTQNIFRSSGENAPGIPDWPAYNDTGIARVDLSQESRWPGFSLREPLSDWRPYSWLMIDAFSPLEIPLDLDVRLETFTDRGLNSIFPVQLLPGANRLKIPISKLTIDGQSPDSVRELLIYTEFGGDRQRYFYLGRLWLE